MATAKKQTVTLQLDLDLPRGKIREFGELLNDATKVKMDSGKGRDIFNSVNTSLRDATTEATKMLRILNKPMKNADMAKQWGKSFNDVFKGLEGKFLNIQGNLSRIFNSKENQEALRLYKEMSDEIENMQKAYDKVAKKNKDRSAIGSASGIKTEITNAKKERKELEKNQASWTKADKERHAELNRIIEDGNKKLEDREKISRSIAKIHKNQGVSGQGELGDKIKMAKEKQATIGSGMFSEADLNALNSLLTEYRGHVRLVVDDLGDLESRSEATWDSINTGQLEAAKRTKTLKDIFKGFGVGIGLTEVARYLKQLALYSFDFYRGLDKALTEISVVTRKTRSEVQGLTKEFISMAKQTGMSIDAIAKGAVLFFQQGLSDKEAMKMTQIAAEFAKVADITVESASDKLTAAVNGYNMAVSQAADVADKLNVLAAESAASIDELATAMEKGASMASQSGLSFDQYNAILATMIEVTREAPENIGTSMKTIMARFQQIKEAGTTEEGDTDVNAVETALKSVGVSLRDEQGVLRDLGDVLDELGPKWNSLDRNTQAYLGTVIAGTRQQSRFISLMQNWDRALELTTASEQSAGAQALQHQLAMEGLEASINNLTIAWQNFLAKLTSSDLFKGVLDSLTAVVGFLSSGNVKGHLFTGALIAGVILLNNHLKHTRALLAEDPNAKTNFLYQLNEFMAGRGSSGLINLLTAMKVAWQLNDVEASNFFTKAIIRAQSLGSVLKDKVVSALKKIKTSIKDAAKSFKEFAGKNPMAIVGIITSIASAIGGFIDQAIFDGEKKLEKANKALDETMNKLEIATGTLSVVETNLATYLELSNVIGRTAAEQEKLNKATEALGEYVKDAVIGYDELGNMMLDIGKIESAKEQAEKDKLDASKDSFGNIGNSIAADLEARGEQAYKDKWYGGISAQSGALGGAAAGALIGTALGGPIIGTAIGAVVGLVGGAVFAAQQAIEEEKKLAAKEYGKLLREHQEDLIKAMDTITDAYISYSDDVYENGKKVASKEEKEQVASRMQSEFLNQRTSEIGKKVMDGDLTSDEAAEELKNLGSEWEDLVIDIGDAGINTITAEAMALKKAVDTENKTWNEIKDQMATVLDNLNIPEESRAAIEEAFKASVYSGTSAGVYQAMKDLENQQKNAKSDAAWEEYYNSGAISGWDKFWIRESKQREEWEKSIDADYEKYWDMVNNMSANKLSAYGKLGISGSKDIMELYDSKYSSSLEKSLGGTDTEIAFAGLDGLYKMERDIKAKMASITDKQSEEYKKWEQMAKDTAEAIDEAWSNIPLAVEKTWKQIFEHYESITDRIAKVRETLAEIKDDGGIDYDQFKELAVLFDDINTKYMSDEQLQKYAKSLNTIAANLKVVNGELVLNQTALDTIADLEGSLAQTQIESSKLELEAKKAEMEAQRDMVESDKAYMETQLAIAESIVNGTYNEAQATEDLNNAKVKFNDNAARLLEVYSENESQAALVYANTWTTAFDQVAEEYNKLMYARLKGTEVEDTEIVKNLNNTLTLDIKPTTSEDYTIDIFNKMSKEDALKAVDDLKKKIAAAQHTIDSYNVSIGNINLKLALLASGIKTLNEGFEDQDAMDEYLSKLEKFLGLLRHIEREEANLGFAGQLKEMQTGVAVIERIGDELEYVAHLIDDTDQMRQNYEDEANKAAVDILKGFGDMVTFDPWGNYDVDMNAYAKLSDEEKDLLDTALQAYDELINDRDKYYEDNLKYIKQQIELNQEYVDAYIKAEDELVEAIKQREQAILDNKLAAIDKEIEAIEKAADARRKARDEEKNSQELSSLQTDLQRALMDSSGASASQILDIQKQIKEKQQEIADTSFDTMVEDMTTQLEEEKDMEQKLFDERLEEMDWYWDEVDRIMAEGTDSIMDTMKLYIDEFNKSSEIQQAELLKGWANTFEQANAIGKKGAQEYQKIVSGYQNEANKLVVDEDIITDETIGTKFVKRPDTGDNKNTGGGGGNGGNKTTTTTKPTTPTKPKPTDTDNKTDSPTRYISLNPGNNKLIILEGKDGDTVTLPGKADVSVGSGYSLIGWKDKDGNVVAGENGGTIKVNGSTSYFGVLRDEKNYWRNSTKGNQLTGELKATGAWLPVKNASGVKQLQNIWEDTRSPGTFYFWKGSEGKYKLLSSIDSGQAVKLLNANLSQANNQYYMGDGKWEQKALYQQHKSKVKHYLRGGMVYGTGPAWLDGTRTNPEAVLNAMQTKAFLQFTDDLAALRSSGNMTANNSVVIDTISFNVDSMSSVQDGERAFNAFVDKFKEIGAKQGISVLGTMNRN